MICSKPLPVRSLLIIGIPAPRFGSHDSRGLNRRSPLTSVHPYGSPLTGTATMALFTTPSPIVVIPTGSAFATPLVTYTSSVDIIIREQINGGGWRLRSTDFPNSATAGSFSPPLRPGFKYEVEGYRSNSVSPSFPNDPTGADPVGGLTIRAIMAGSSTNFLTEPIGPEVGGTYCWVRIAAGSVPTFATLQVGSSAPAVDASGLLIIPNAEHAIESDEKLAHELEAEPLRPGSNFFFVATALDTGSPSSTGRFFQASGPITTKQRVATILLKELVVTDDSDPGAFGTPGLAGPGRFAFQIREMGAGQSTVFKDFSFTISQFTDKAPNNKIDLSPYGTAALIPGKPLIETNEFIGIALRGVEEDASTFFDTDDIAETPFGLATTLVLPTGRFKENVSGKKQKTAAPPRSAAHQFSFHVNVEFSVIHL